MTLWLVKIKQLLSKLPWLVKLVKGVFKLVALLTPQGMHLVYKKVVNGKCDVTVKKVDITENDDNQGFTAHIEINVTSENKEALTSIKTEIENRPLENLKNS